MKTILALSRYYNTLDHMIPILWKCQNDFKIHLINTNLEAIKENCCMINLDSYNKFNIDIFTKKIIPNSCVVRLDRNNTSEHLMNEINNFYNNREQIKFIQNNMKKLDKHFIPSWDKRIEEEFSIIEKL